MLSFRWSFPHFLQRGNLILTTCFATSTKGKTCDLGDSRREWQPVTDHSRCEGMSHAITLFQHAKNIRKAIRHHVQVSENTRHTSVQHHSRIAHTHALSLPIRQACDLIRITIQRLSLRLFSLFRSGRVTAEKNETLGISVPSF